METGKVDRVGNKIEKPEAVYYYCSRMGGVDLSDQLLNYFTFLRKSTKWSRKLLIHLFNLVILNAYILNKHYGSKKLTQDEFRDWMVKYLLREGLKCYKIPLPPVLSKKIGRNHEIEHNTQRLHERHFITNIPGAEGRREKDQHGPALFVVNCLGSIANLKGLHFGVKIVVKLYVLHHVSKFTTLKLITNYMH